MNIPQVFGAAVLVILLGSVAFAIGAMIWWNAEYGDEYRAQGGSQYAWMGESLREKAGGEPNDAYVPLNAPRDWYWREYLPKAIEEGK